MLTLHRCATSSTAGLSPCSPSRGLRVYKYNKIRWSANPQGTFPPVQAYPFYKVMVMKAYFANLPMRTWLLLVVPAVAISYPVVRIVVPAVLHAVVPEVVRNVLHVI
jgi:hypothetical protein